MDSITLKILKRKLVKYFDITYDAGTGSANAQSSYLSKPSDGFVGAVVVNGATLPSTWDGAQDTFSLNFAEINEDIQVTPLSFDGYQLGEVIGKITSNRKSRIRPNEYTVIRGQRKTLNSKIPIILIHNPDLLLI